MRLMQPELNRLGAAMFDNANQDRSSTRGAPPCPKCGAKGLRIVYGMPDGPIPPEGCTWGGCVIEDAAPKFACSECDATWGRL